MKRRFLYLLDVIIILISTSYFSYSQNIYNRVYTVQDGLAQSQVLSLCQDRKGLIWIGTAAGGISVFDGLNFKNITKDDGLAGNSVYSIIQDKKGNLWAGTDRGLTKISGKEKTNYTTNEGLPDNSVWKVFEDHSGTIWVGTGKGIASIKDNKLVAFKGSTDISQSTIYTIFEDKEFNLWLGTKGNGVFKIAGTIITQYTKNNGLSNNTVWTINQDSQDNIILGTSVGLNSIKKDTILVSENWTITSSIELKDEILFSNYAGLIFSIKNFSNGKPIIPFYQKFDGIAIRSILKDLEGNIWLGTEAGLIKIPPTPFYNWNKAQKLNGDNIFSIINGSNTFEFWFGSYGNGASNFIKNNSIHLIKSFITFRSILNKADKDKIKLSNKERDKIISRNLIGSNILASVRDNKNRIWFGTTVGLSIYNPIDSFFVHITNDPADKVFKNVIINYKLPNKYFNCLTLDYLGNIWGGTMSGIIVFSDTTIIQNNAELNKLNNIPVYNIYQDKSKCYWISTQEGLFKYNGITLKHFTKKDNFIESQINSVTQDKHNNLWIASKEGIYCFNNKTFEKFDHQLNGLASNNIYLIIIDKTGDYLFIGTEKGLDKLNLKTYYSKKEIEIRHYGQLEGFMGLECNRNACYLDSLGRIWFGTVNGVTMYDPEKDGLNTRKPNTYITNILNNFQADSLWKQYYSDYDKVTGLPINLVLPYDKNHITFHFVANSLSAPEKVLYKYMMEGIDTSWTPPMARNEADFPTLPPGKYTFKVKACNNDGIWSEVPATYSFEISPPWYFSLWFIIPAIIVIIILIFVFIKYREAALRRDKIRLEKTVTERTSEVVHQKEIVEQKNKDITDSINYAKNIQEALLPTRAEIGKHFPESFMLYKPRDIVSGDFYWISHRGNRTYYAIADCTGHGVPGAFMSMLGIAFLDEVIGMNPVIESNELLNQLRQNVILSLRQTGEAGQSKDGMDINLVVVDWDKKILEYSGANNPLYLIRNSYLTEYKGDKMPIGVHINKEPFSIHRIPFSLGDSIYMFSDGYADQFGGPNNKKFKYKSLKELLIKISNQPMSDQGKILNKTIEEWKGDNSQLDDIIVAGVHFGKITISL